MITVIHGDDTVKSREYYTTIREKHPEKIILDGASLTITDFLQATSNAGLFGDQKAIFIEELLSKRKSSKELDALVTTIIHSQSPIVLWESKELTPKQLTPFNKETIKVFKIPTVVFAFVDSLQPNNGTKMISLFHELLRHEDAAFALFMLQRQIRILLGILSDTGETIGEIKRIAPWQKTKLQKQAKAFSQQQLLDIHALLYDLEVKQKTGGLSTPLNQSIDFLLLSL